jgi:oligoendopeptidase F
MASSTAAGKLPEWDLTDLYPATQAPSLLRDSQKAGQLADSFCKRYEGKVETLDAETLAEAIAAYEAFQDLIGRLGSYAQLCYAKAMNNPETARFFQNMQERLTDLSSQTLFFTLAINRIEEVRLSKMLASPSLSKYAPWLRDVRVFRPYQLADDMEKILHEKAVAGRAAWMRLFDETIARMRFPIGNKKLTEPEALDLMSSPNAVTRKKAALVIGKTFKEHAPVFALITNTLAKDKDIEDRWRGFKAPISSRNVSNFIEDAVVETLMSTVQKNYPDLSHRYYAIKAKWFGKKQLDYWDRNAPLPMDKDKKYTWKEAQALVLTAYKNFSPSLAEIGAEFFKKGWIDAPVKPGKSPGAFAHPTVPSAHPYLLLNFQGKTRDVMTLAHELGHGVHQVLSAKQGALMCDTPLTLAETASVFGEQLAFRELLRKEKNERRRKIMIASKVEDMLNTVVRQVAFCEFEKRVHTERKQGELTPDRICDIWMEVQGAALGPAIKLHGDYRYFWTYIPHFIHSPFYVYAYAFGDCLVNSLYAVYEREAARGKGKDFEKKYLTMLEAGGTLHHKDLLAPFGLDATRPDFWQQGLNVIAGFIEELEAS